MTSVNDCGFVVADSVLDDKLVPTELIADTRYVYVVLAASPESEYVVAVPDVFVTIVDHAVPPSVDRSIM